MKPLISFADEKIRPESPKKYAEKSLKCILYGEDKMNHTNKFSIRDIAIVGMAAAICAVSMIFKIPYGTGAMFHFGTAAIFTLAILFGGIRAGLAAAIGTAFYDLLMGFSPYTIWSFFIKGIAGLILGYISHSAHTGGKSIIRNIIGCILSAIWTLIGYLVAWTFVIGKFESALANAPSSIVNSVIGLIVAIPLAATLRIALEKAGILGNSASNINSN
ncbi:MAG: ECF transporter S component [Clostridia bacterium]|nr:ECF transporter S component [Clostridia bacterium]